MRPDRYTEVAHEALCSAFYNMPFVRFLGERADAVNGTDTAWFRICDDPTQEVTPDKHRAVVVAVRYDTEQVISLDLSWLNHANGETLRCGQSLRLVCDPDQEQATMAAAEAAVLRALEVYTDVLNETGVAGPLSENTPESAADDDYDEDFDLAATDEEAGRE